MASSHSIAKVLNVIKIIYNNGDDNIKTVL